MLCCLLDPPKIDSDVEVIFQNDTMLCALWRQSKQDAEFDIVKTELQQPQGTTLDTVESQIDPQVIITEEWSKRRSEIYKNHMSSSHTE